MDDVKRVLNSERDDVRLRVLPELRYNAPKLVTAQRFNTF